MMACPGTCIPYLENPRDDTRSQGQNTGGSTLLFNTRRSGLVQNQALAVDEPREANSTRRRVEALKEAQMESNWNEHTNNS